MDWEGPAATAAEEKLKKQKEVNRKEAPIGASKQRGSYVTKNEPKVVNLTNLMQKFEHMSIREAASKVGLAKSTAIRKIKEWNELTNSSNQGVFPDTINKKEHKGRKVILQDVYFRVTN
ncbi:hypothetical protein EDC94DRAFT_623439 [Helicostylum pulchrum]|nr:hypothetical protein EDC94DRAFT_623439 [Helicostylum pulchrum]